MDQPGLDVRLHRNALRGLARINRISRSSEILWRPISRFARECRRPRNQPFRLLDVACGSGDVAIALSRRAEAVGLPLSIIGCDISQTAVEEARSASQGQSQLVRFERCDILATPPNEEFDIVTSSLFLHHLKEEDAVALLRWMGRATRQLLLVNDLVRSPGGYAAAWVACRTLSRSPIVRVDGPRSVAGAFTVEEVRALCGQVPLHGFRVANRWPWRFLLEWSPRRGV